MRWWWPIALALGCTPSEAPLLPVPGHVVLFVDTDAPTSLFDRLRAEVYAADASTPCSTCTREFVVDDEAFRAGASFVVRSEGGETGTRVKLSLLRAGTDGVAGTRSTIEQVVVLPTQPAEGAREVTAVLEVESLGLTRGSLVSPLPVAEGRPAPSRVGTWSGATVVPCAGAPRENEVCIPGGAFWFGDRSARLGMFDGLDERLVVLSPFFLETREVTVGELRRIDAGAEVLHWSGASGNAVRDACTFALDGGRDDAPANCVGTAVARRFCRTRGGDLPSEAQYERAARPFAGVYPWGAAPPRCDGAVWGVQAGFPGGPCLDAGIPAGPVPIAALERRGMDRVALDGGVLLDLAGNLRELTCDCFARDDDPCWQWAWRKNPVCETAASCARTTRGGSWHDARPEALSATARGFAYQGDFEPTYAGFRCARPAVAP